MGSGRRQEQAGGGTEEWEGPQAEASAQYYLTQAKQKKRKDMNLR